MAPTDIHACRRLLEVPPGTKHFVATQDPIYLFLDFDNRLMKVVQVGRDEYRKISIENSFDIEDATHG